MKKSNGFTLIELAIVIAIIGVMAGIAVSKYFDMSREAELTGCKEFVKGLQTSSAVYLMKTKTPPSRFSDFVTSGKVEDPYVISTEAMLNSGHIVSFSPADYTSKTLTVTTKSGAVVNYYIDGTSVTAKFP